MAVNLLDVLVELSESDINVFGKLRMWWSIVYIADGNFMNVG